MKTEGEKMEAMRHGYQWILCVCIFVVSAVLSCTQSDSGANFEGNLFIKLHDAPASIQKLNIVIQRVSIHRTGSSADVGWSIINIMESNWSVDVITLRNGASKLLVTDKAPVGKYGQIKLRFGPCTVNNNIPLPFNSALQNEQILDYNFEIKEGETCKLSFDLDVYHSVKTVNGDYLFEPEIRVQNIEFCGDIVGSILAPDLLRPDTNIVVAASIFTAVDTDSISTFNESGTGSFQLSDLPEGAYQVRIVPENPLYQDTIFNDVVVKAQKKTAVGVGVVILRSK